MTRCRAQRTTRDSENRGAEALSRHPLIEGNTMWASVMGIKNEFFHDIS